MSSDKGNLSVLPPLAKLADYEAYEIVKCPRCRRLVNVEYLASKGDDVYGCHVCLRGQA